MKEGGWISGEEIAKSLGISRTGVWNHIKKLKELGFKFHSSAKRGYKLLNIPDILIPPLIKSYLHTNFIGTQIYFYEELGSTQNQAKNLAEGKEKEGTVVLCEIQKKGKGRRGREWVHVPYKSIAFSIILRPPLIPSQVMQLPLMAGVALCETIREYTKVNCFLKWPNDLLINNKKTAGILAEISGDSEQVQYIILGIGINVNVEIQDIPIPLRDYATSLLIETGKRYLRAELLAHILKNLEHWYKLYITKGFSPVRQRWLELSNTIGKDVIIFLQNTKLLGKAIEIDEVGNLILLDESGNKQKIFCGDVTLRNKI